MLQKTISIYSERTSSSPLNNRNLVVEIGKQHIACLVKEEKDGSVIALEYFQQDEPVADWQEALHELRLHSMLLDKVYAKTQVYYNVAEAVQVPSHKFNEDTAAMYLELSYGPAVNRVIKYDKLHSAESLYNVYRVDASLAEMVNRAFISIEEQHSYTSLLTHLLATQAPAIGNTFTIQFYPGYFVVAALRNNKLQLVQAYDYVQGEDVLYHLMNIAHQLEIDTTDVLVNVGGAIEDAQLHTSLKNTFPRLQFQLNTQVKLLQDDDAIPAYYLTPFLNLAV